MTEAQMVKHIQERMKSEYEIDVKRDVIKKIINIEADEIYTCVALNDSYKYLWGTISGVSKPPEKMVGKVSQNKSVIENHGYSKWKLGYPKIEWAKSMKVCEIRTADEYFEQDEIRYTSAARKFRQDAGFPEIPEYEGLPEEKIQELCAKADAIQWNKLTRRQQMRKAKDHEKNTFSRMRKYEYWQKTGYTPYGETIDWEGDHIDAVDHYLKVCLQNATNLQEKLEAILYSRDFADWLHLLEAHPELGELEAQTRAELEEAGLEPLPHTKIDYDAWDKFTLHYSTDKRKADSWGVRNETVSNILRKQREEMVYKTKQDLYQELVDYLEESGEKDLTKEEDVKEKHQE